MTRWTGTIEPGENHTLVVLASFEIQRLILHKIVGELYGARSVNGQRVTTRYQQVKYNKLRWLHMSRRNC